MRHRLFLTLTLAVLLTPTGPSVPCQEMAPAMACCPPSAPSDLTLGAPSCCRVAAADGAPGMSAPPPAGTRTDHPSRVIATGISPKVSDDAIGILRVVRPLNLPAPRLSVPLFLLNASIRR